MSLRLRPETLDRGISIKAVFEKLRKGSKFERLKVGKVVSNTVELVRSVTKSAMFKVSLLSSEMSRLNWLRRNSIICGVVGKKSFMKESIWS